MTSTLTNCPKRHFPRFSHCMRSSSTDSYHIFSRRRSWSSFFQSRMRIWSSAMQFAAAKLRIFAEAQNCLVRGCGLRELAPAASGNKEDGFTQPFVEIYALHSIRVGCFCRIQTSSFLPSDLLFLRLSLEPRRVHKISPRRLSSERRLRGRHWRRAECHELEERSWSVRVGFTPRINEHDTPYFIRTEMVKASYSSTGLDKSLLSMQATSG